MKKLLALVCFLLTLNASATELKWSGSTSLRSFNKKSDDGLATRDTEGHDTSVTTERRWEGRANLAVQGSAGDHTEWAMGIRTQSSPGSEYLPFNNATDLALSLEQAVFRYTLGLGDFGESVFLLGRQKNVVAYDAAVQSLFDNDVRFDGLGASWKKGNIGFNTTYYILGANNAGAAPSSSSFTKTDASENVATTKSSFASLISFQPTFKHEFSSDISALFALGYHVWSTNGFYTNAIHGGVAGTAGNINPVIVNNARQWQFLTTVNLPYTLVFTGEFLRNKKQFYGTALVMTDKQADRDAWSVGVNYGKVKKAWDYGIGYYYTEKGIASAINRFSYSDLLPDNKAHLIRVKLGVTESLSFTAAATFAKEKAMVDGAGLNLTGANASRKQTSSRYDFVANVVF